MDRKKNKRGHVLMSAMMVQPDLFKYVIDQAKKRRLSMTTIVNECIQFHKENSKT